MIEVLFKRNTEADNSTMQRYNAIFESMYLFLLSPVFGNFISLTQFTSNQMVAHNAILEIAASQGVISLFIFTAAFVYPFIKVKNSDHKNRLLFGSIIAGSILFHFTLTSIPFKEQYLILVLSMAYVSTSFVEFDISAEIVKLKLIKRIHYIKDGEYFEEPNLLVNTILFSKQQVIFLSPKYTNIDGLVGSFLDKGINVKVLSLNEGALYNLNDQDLYIIDAFDAKDDDHLKTLNRIQKKSNYKLIVINDERIYQNGVFSLSSYGPLLSKRSFTQKDENRISQKKTKVSKATKSNKWQISRKYSDLINSLFSFLFTFLSILSVHYANTESNLGSKIILIILSVAFYFQMTSIIFSKERLGYSWQKKMVYYIITTFVPISLFIIASFITAINIKLTATISIYISFVAVSSFIPIFIKKKHS